MDSSRGSTRTVRAVTGAALAMIAFAGTPARGQITVFTAALSGSQVAPPNGSPGTGFVTVTLNQTTNTLDVAESFSGLTANPTAAHIHCCVAPGNSGAIAIPFNDFLLMAPGTSGIYTHLFDLTDATTFSAVFLTGHGNTAASARAALIAGMFAQLTYSNIHTTNFPGGEISGQLVVAAPEPGSLVLFGSGLAVLVGLARSRRRMA